jgi:thioredoxin
MFNRRHVIRTALAAAAGLFGASIAAAADEKPFDQAAFAAAQQAGKPILVHVTAPWCPTCKAQAPILSRLMSDPRFKNLVTFDIDFDTQKELLGKFQVRLQSTMIVFKGKQETGRSTGDTNPGSIEALLAKAI